ncbi:response regulator [Aliikangiella sp. G2MR2-5]|uniref:response regulator n=1 Tax=Aliikangiella sp. G2MR2-5 TaxID=2788943 RepID=UPI0018AA4598|nr:response regulator [Aliikangiella sp. G2MR2-5]
MMKKPLVRYSQKTVLIVEDFAEFARSLRGMMSTMGSKKIDLVYNGEDAIQACKERKYDIILSDYNLGDSKDGQQMLEELIEFDLLKSTTVFVMVTAENTTAMVMGALEYQPDSYLTKPFNGHILKSRLDKAIHKKDVLAPMLRNIRKKKWKDALKECELIEEENPKFRMACERQKLKCLMALRQYDKALELTTKIVNERPIPWAMLGVGEVFFAKKEYERAIDLFTDMTNEFPMVLEGYDWLAKTQRVLGRPIEAQHTLERAIERSPKALKRQKLLGDVAEENDDVDTMTMAFRQAVKYGKNSVFASPDEYVKLTKSIGRQLKGNSDVDRQKLLDEAESVFSKLDSRFKSDAGTQFRSAVAHADFSSITNDQQKVEKYLAAANKYYDRIEEHIGCEESLEITESLKHLGQSELAESILEEAVEQYFDDPKFIEQAKKLTTNKNLIANSQKANKLNNKAIKHFSQKEYTKACEYFGQALEIAPNNVNINLNNVQTLLKRYQSGEKKPEILHKAEELLSNITRLAYSDPRYERYSELSRLTQLMMQSL